MYTATSIPVRAAITSFVVGAIALISACAVDPTNGIAGSGPTGSLGSRCNCPNSAADCSGDQGQCQSGLDCRTLDSGNQVCSINCPCPINFICKEIGVPTQRLSCVK